jgi:hypothetical protein
MIEERKRKIAETLKEKGVKLPCPRCSGLDFEVVDQTALSINDNLNVVRLGGTSVPAALIICSQCGFITFHALGVLNLIPKNENT